MVEHRALDPFTTGDVEQVGLVGTKDVTKRLKKSVEELDSAGQRCSEETKGLTSSGLMKSYSWNPSLTRWLPPTRPPCAVGETRAKMKRSFL